MAPKRPRAAEGLRSGDLDRGQKKTLAKEWVRRKTNGLGESSQEHMREWAKTTFKLSYAPSQSTMSRIWTHRFEILQYDDEDKHQRERTGFWASRIITTRRLG
jgi:hypothetical protein